MRGLVPCLPCKVTKMSASVPAAGMLLVHSVKAYHTRWTLSLQEACTIRVGLMPKLMHCLLQSGYCLLSVHLCQLCAQNFNTSYSAYLQVVVFCNAEFDSKRVSSLALIC